MLHILAPGPGIAHYVPDGRPTLGVHYAAKYVPNLTRVYIQDYPDTFEPWKLDIITNHPPRKGYVMAHEFRRPPFDQLPLANGFDHMVWMQCGLGAKTHCPVGPSAGFSAAAWAAWMGMTRITVWGCDYTAHPAHQHNLEWIRQHWLWLRDAMAERGGRIEVKYDCPLRQWLTEEMNTACS